MGDGLWIMVDGYWGNQWWLMKHIIHYLLIHSPFMNLLLLPVIDFVADGDGPDIIFLLQHFIE